MYRSSIVVGGEFWPGGRRGVDEEGCDEGRDSRGGGRVSEKVTSAPKQSGPRTSVDDDRVL